MHPSHGISLIIFPKPLFPALVFLEVDFVAGCCIKCSFCTCFSSGLYMFLSVSTALFILLAGAHCSGHAIVIEGRICTY